MRSQVRTAVQAVKRTIGDGHEPHTVLAGPARGVRMCLNLESQTQTWVGMYEIELNRHLRRLCRPGTTCLDVGGGRGYHALLFAHLAQAPVVTFEPSRRALALLRASLDLNPSLRHLVTVVPEMAGDAGVRVDDWCAEHDFEPGLLKVDVDGGELDVLQSAEATLLRNGPPVVLETHSLELERDCGALLQGLGYRVRIVNQRRVFREHRPPLERLAGGAHNRWLVAERD
jgi:SAM-dependent methyltransferase